MGWTWVDIMDVGGSKGDEVCHSETPHVVAYEVKVFPARLNQ
jgi:hypothetical protein